jgi:hypothetical protein
MPRSVCSSAIIPTWILFAVIIASAFQINVAQARDAQRNTRADLTLVCGKELTNRCSGVPVLANNMLECLHKERGQLSKRCAALGNTVVRMCERDAAQLCQGVVAGSGNIFGCLSAARRSVSTRCNTALDAAFLR